MMGQINGNAMNLSRVHKFKVRTGLRMDCITCFTCTFLDIDTLPTNMLHA